MNDPSWIFVEESFKNQKLWKREISIEDSED